MRLTAPATAAVIASLAPYAAYAQATGDAPAPNIVFFLADDMGIGDTSAYQDLTGNANPFQIDTPNMERLAALGTRFTDAHSGAAVCTPTRLGFLTGSHPYRASIRQRTSFVNQETIASHLQGTRQTVGQMLSEAGYGTYGVGKWHIGMQVDFANHTVFEGPIQAGFDHYTGTPGNFPGDQGILVDNTLLTYDAAFNLVPYGDPDAIAWDPTDTDFTAGSNRAITEQIQQTNLDAAQQYLADHTANRADDPFFLYYASHSNHTPFIAGDELDGNTIDGHTKASGYLDVPTTTDGDGNVIPTGPLYGNLGLDNHWNPYLEVDGDGNVTRNGVGERARLVDENDIALGELMDYLESTPDPRNPGHMLIDNTLIVFSSDNGSDIDSEPSVGQLPQSSDGVTTDLSGKKANWEEGGTRVPFIAAWGNRIGAGDTSDALVSLTDMYATFAALAGVELDANEAVDSADVSGALLDDAGYTRDGSLVYKSRDRLVIRRGEFKLVVEDPDADRNGSKFDGNLDYADLEVFRFFDLSNDLGETNRLESDPAHQALIASMLAELQGYVDDGHIRTGATAIGNGVNFQGNAAGDADILDAANYLGYNDDAYDADNDGTVAQLARLTTDNPTFIFRDGVASGRVDNAWLIHGNGTVRFNASQAGLTGSLYEIRGGSVTATTAFQVNDGSVLLLNGGTLDLGSNQLRLTKGDGLISLVEGDATARILTLGDLGSATDGTKIVRFEPGNGATLTLTDTNPIRIGDDGSTSNDYIDFVTGTQGQLISIEDQAYFEALFDAGHLRVDGQTAADLPLAFEDYFDFTALNGTQAALSLGVVPEPATAAALLGLGLAVTSRRRR